MEAIYALYWELDTERPIAEGGIARIPASKIRAELERLGIVEPWFGWVHGIIRSLERAHQEWAAERFQALVNRAKK